MTNLMQKIAEDLLNDLDLESEFWIFVVWEHIYIHVL